ncbi:MAG TPA: ribosome-associated translation inhibitor RaiA [Rikenellaceae bacterium]|nr:ribosome-associated translation inhibitor RaiA [Rikenellaceae bacterium]
MKIVIKGTNCDLTPSIKEYVYEKVGALQKVIRKVLEAQVELEVSKRQKSGEIYRAEIMLFVPRDLLRATEEATDMYAAIDLVIPKIRRQIEKYKGKLRDRNIKKARKFSFADLLNFSPVPKEQEPLIVKRKKFSMSKPMYEEEAIRQMELLGHDFFVFINADSDKISVVYKRDDGDYGVIEAE